MFARLSIRGGPVTFTCLKWYLVLPAFKENCMGGVGGGGGVMVFNATFNFFRYIVAVSLLVEESGILREDHHSATSH